MFKIGVTTRPKNGISTGLAAVSRLEGFPPPRRSPAERSEGGREGVASGRRREPAGDYTGERG